MEYRAIIEARVMVIFFLYNEDTQKLGKVISQTKESSRYTAERYYRELLFFLRSEIGVFYIK